MKTCLKRLALCASMAVVSLPATSLAQTPVDSLPQTTVGAVEVRGNAIRVNYSDLNTNSAAGMMMLDDRVDSAAVAVCRFYRGRLLDATREFDCRAGAKDAAWAQFARNEQRAFASNERWIQLAVVNPVEN